VEKSVYLTVVKSNKVIEASYLLSLSEQRVLLACIAQIDSTAELTEQYQFQVSAGQSLPRNVINGTNPASFALCYFWCFNSRC
jgi:hypothetical protein